MQRTDRAPITPNLFGDPSPHPSHLSDLLPSSKQLAWPLVRDPDLLTIDEHAVLQHVCQDKQVGQLHRLARQFVSMVKQRLADQLDPWLEACETFSALQIQNFAASLGQDYAAVRAALDMPWSNGQTKAKSTGSSF